MSTRVLIAGGEGFLGKFMTETFRKRGFEVSIFDSKLAGAMEGTQISSLYDFMDHARPDVILNLMALCGSRGKGGCADSLSRPYDFFRNNVLTMLNVCEAARQLDVKKVVQMSSFSVHGKTDSVITKDTVLNPIDPYGGSKQCAEIICRIYSICYGMHIVIVRAPLIVGENQEEKNAVNEFVELGKADKPIVIFGRGAHRREWLHPLDVSEAFVNIVEYMETMKEPFRIFVLGSETNRISMNDLANRIIARTGGSVVHDYSKTNVFDQVADSSDACKSLRWKAKRGIDEILDRVLSG